MSAYDSMFQGFKVSRFDKKPRLRGDWATYDESPLPTPGRNGHPGDESPLKPTSGLNGPPLLLGMRDDFGE